ncbi:hypothetical protein QQS21_003554 [Conoideocrella luteorostrata]|uniref:N-acetyltransferase domain-containing protein n=1 Tax=Conoideocrella luteorostrata TaxID=1105319 RepID=A0AAJ0G266_9HYPO|nr:hypothetical protein QQS21_003554 [Conoideocrella luteorostrata]
MSIIIREMKVEDLHAIVDIAKLAFPYDKQFVYKYPYREEYPEEHHKNLTIRYTEYLNSTFAGRNTIMIAEAPDLTEPNVAKVVAFSIWSNVGTSPPGQDTAAIAPSEQHYERKDCNTERLKAYRAATTKARKDIFARMYGERQSSLRQLATLPEYWHRGVGTQLLHWGMERSREQGVPITLFAGPMGKNLYEKHGFKELEKVHVQVDGESAAIFQTAMSWNPKLDTDDAQ